MNILFLELAKVINNSATNIFDQKKIEGKVYNVNPSYIENINKLVKEFDFYLVITSNQDVPYDSVLFTLDQLGLDGTKVLDVLPYVNDNSEKMKRIQSWFEGSRYSEFDYLVIDNYDNIQPSPVENIYLVINGFNDQELKKARARFTAITNARKVAEDEKNKRMKKPSEKLGAASAELITLQNSLTVAQTEAEQQTAEAEFILKNNIDLFRKKAAHQNTYEARKELRKYILDKFPKANVETVDALLTRKRFIQSKDTMMFGVVPATVAGAGSLYGFTDLGLLAVACSTVAIFVATDLLSWLAIDSGTLKIHK